LAFTFAVNVIPGLAKIVFGAKSDLDVVQELSKYKASVDGSDVEPRIVGLRLIPGLAGDSDENDIVGATISYTTDASTENDTPLRFP
jgi:hypothetical protein